MAIGGQVGRYNSALDASNKRYQQMIADLTEAKTAAKEEIAPELLQNVGIYATGGEYGAGARTSAERIAKENLGITSANLAATGMSSGSLAAGVRSKYSRGLSEQLQQIEDVRYDKLSTALVAVAAAKEARGSRVANAYLSSAQLTGGFKAPATSEFASQEDIASEESDTQRYIANRTTSAALLAKQMEINAQKASQESSQSFTAGESSKYNLTAPQLYGLEQDKLGVTKYNAATARGQSII